MIDIINTGKFLFQQQSKIFLPAIFSEYTHKEKNIEFLIYKPKDKTNRGSKKVILAVHGMSPYGNKDERFIEVCKSLAGCGYIVISPKFDLIQNLKIDPRSIDNIASVIEYITDRPDICPESKLSIFTVSFSGSLCLLASCRTNTCNKVKSICTIGAFHSIENILSYLLEDPESNPYGRLIVLKNFLKYSIDVSGELDTAFDIAIQDNFLKRNPPLLESHVQTLSKKDNDILTRVLNNTDYRMGLWDIIINNKEIIKKKEELTIDVHLDKLSASILIVHGKTDNIIPYEESVRLHDKLKTANKNSKLILTPLLGHSSLKLDLNILPAVIDLFKGMSFFFKTA